MVLRARYALPCAGLLAWAGASCAAVRGQSGESPNPATQQAMAAQKQSEEALKRAEEAQKRASEQAQKASEAQAQVRRDQQKLAQDQATARQEQARAEHLQTQAKQEAQQAARIAQEQQGIAGTALAQQTRQSARGQQMAAGVVTQVRPDEVVLQPASGDLMRFRIDDRTKVQVEGRQASTSEIREGSQARVAYEASSDGPKAVWIRLGGANAQSPAATGTGSSAAPDEPTPGEPSSTSGAQGTGSAPTATEPAQPPPPAPGGTQQQ